MTTASFKEQWKQGQERALNDFFTFLKFKSVSSEPAFKEEMTGCANWLVAHLQQIGFETELWNTAGHPIIYASHLKAGPEQPTLLIYNHYDVQPTDPDNAWNSKPFSPEVRGGEVFARGAQDNKGQCFYVMEALRMLLESDGKLPVNVKLCIEGEEEVGSFSLAKILDEKKKELQADYLAIVDLGIPKPDIPAITLGVRGIVTLEVSVQNSRTDLHSGSHGGLAYNPIHALVEMLAKLRDPSGKIAIPNFYDEVAEVEKGTISFDFDENEYEALFGMRPTGGETAFTPLERAWIRPTVEINGIIGGYTGMGFKTVISATASAKISCRLVPNQDPQKTGRLVAHFLEKQAPPGITVKTVVYPGGGMAARTDSSSKGIQAFAAAYTEVFGKPCRYILEGASIPIIPELAAASQAEAILLGLGLADDNIHAPNEHFGIDRLEKGALIIARALQLLAV